MGVANCSLIRSVKTKVQNMRHGIQKQPQQQQQGEQHTAAHQI